MTPAIAILVDGEPNEENEYMRTTRTALLVVLVFALAITASAERTRLKPGWNLFSPQQDIELGRESAQQVEREMPLVHNTRAEAYISALGKRLASFAPGNEGYPFQFKIINDKNINAFALPGGFVYVNRGAIESADNEAQLAGVIGHETGHVVLRHGTNQVSKSYLAQAPLAILGSVFGSNSLGGIVARLGGNLAITSLMLKYSRTDESQADLIGTQILYDAGYDPNAMVEFFEKIEQESKGSSVEFFSDHPKPENRISNVQKEIQKLGGLRPNPKIDSPEFQAIKKILLAMPAPPKTPSRGQ